MAAGAGGCARGGQAGERQPPAGQGAHRHGAAAVLQEVPGAHLIWLNAHASPCKASNTASQQSAPMLTPACFDLALWVHEGSQDMLMVRLMLMEGLSLPLSCTKKLCAKPGFI